MSIQPSHNINFATLFGNKDNSSGYSGLSVDFNTLVNNEINSFTVNGNTVSIKGTNLSVVLPNSTAIGVDEQSGNWVINGIETTLISDSISEEIINNYKFDAINNTNIDLPMNYQYFNYGYKGAGIKNNELYILGSNNQEIIKINSNYEIIDVEGYFKTQYFMIDNNTYNIINKHNIYSITSNNEIIEMNYNYQNVIVQNQGAINQTKYDYQSDTLYAFINDKLYKIQNNEQTLITDQQNIKKYAFDKNYIYFIKNNFVYSIVDNQINQIKYGIKDIISLPNAEFIYGISDNDKLIKINDSSYSYVNGFKNNEKVTDIMEFGNNDIAINKYEIVNLTSTANLCTYAGCIGNVLAGYGNIYWNSK